ncbi:hypothetical protein LSH36_39g06000 [Paralvinella palmiformis]|uniref:Uncharacterized protein n=1 Tax=Paralvinella palmiformis TaxID=53620 RepID=A0AAD9K846_9ANNE|nr:hypothetical protein LSH36_39g06000 [Paralvinella palmiformis]
MVQTSPAEHYRQSPSIGSRASVDSNSDQKRRQIAKRDNPAPHTLRGRDMR